MDTPAFAAWRAAAAHVDSHRLAEAESVLRPYVQADDLDPSTHARILLEWGWLMGATQRHDEAARAFDRVIRLAPTAELRSEALLEAGTLARYEGRYDDAETLLAEAAAAWPTPLRTGQTLAQRAATDHQRHRFPEARERLDELAAVLDRCPPGALTDQLRADFCHHAGVSARVAQRFDDAKKLLEEAHDRYAALGRRIGTANAVRELGAVLDQVGDAPGARDAYGRAFAAYLRAGRRLGAAHAARRLGQLRLLQVPEDPDAEGYARRRFTQALRLGAGEPGNRILCELFLARLDRLTGNLDAAQRRLTALPFDQSPDAARDLSQAALEYGLVARARGDRGTAIEMFAQALRPLDEDTDPSAASIAHHQLAYDLVLDERIEEALEHAVAAFRLSEPAGRRLRGPADRETFYRDHRQHHILALHCAARLGDGETAFAVANAARAEAVAAFIAAGARFSDELRTLVDAITLAADAPDRLPALYARLEELTGAELRRAVTESAAGLAETCAALPPGGHALLVDVLEDENTIANRIWVRADGTVTVDEVFLPPPVRVWLDRYHAAEEGLAAGHQDDELAALGDALIPAGLAAALIAGPPPPLVVSTGGVLGPVPVAALRVGGRYLAELARIAVVPAISLWAPIRSRPPRHGTGVAAYLDQDLPGTKRERTALAQAFPQARFLSRPEVRPTLADASSLAAVVLSVHGTATPGLGQSLLLAEDDRLAAAELLTCRLPEAVLIPACWAGRLDLRAAVEPLGLPTAALLAGARWVLAGTVDITATSTARLLGQFYTELASGRTPVDALRAVQIHYLSRRTTAPPSLWAGLSIVGDGFGFGG